MATNPYTAKVNTLNTYKSQIVIKRDSLTSLISTLESDINSIILSANSMPNDYYKKFVTNETTALSAAKKIRNNITNTITTIDSRLTSLRTKRDNWVDPTITTP